MITKVTEIKDKFVKVHKEVRAKSGDLNVKQSIDDVLSLIGEWKKFKNYGFILSHD